MPEGGRGLYTPEWLFLDLLTMQGLYSDYGRVSLTAMIGAVVFQGNENVT